MVFDKWSLRKIWKYTLLSALNNSCYVSPLSCFIVAVAAFFFVHSFFAWFFLSSIFFWVFGCWLIAYSNFNAFKRVHILLGALIYLTNSLIKNRRKKRFFFYFISNDRNQKRNEPKASEAKKKPVHKEVRKFRLDFMTANRKLTNNAKYYIYYYQKRIQFYMYLVLK